MSWTETLARLTKWSDAKESGIGRPWPPVYNNLSELRADVRELLAEFDKVCEMFENVMSTMSVEYEDMFPPEEEDE